MKNQQGAPEALRLAAIANSDGHITNIERNQIARELRRLHYENERLAAQADPQQPAPSAAATVGEVPLPLLVRDIAADLGTTPIQVCIALAQLGFGGHSVNMAVTPRMAKSLRAHFASTTPQADSAPLAAPADTVVLEAALRAIHQAIDLIGEPDTERLRTVRRVLRGAVVVAEDCKEPQADSQPAPQQKAPADELEEVLRERDDAEDFINELLDEVLGADRPEWSSAYNRYDAMNDVRERITALHKPAVDKAWGRFESAMAAPQPSPTPQADSAPAEAVQRIVHLRTDRERRVYVAGPMTGLPEYNFPLFNATAARLRSEGWHVENPAEHGHVEGAGWSDYLRWDISRIATCGAIYLLPGWSKSKGATLEVHVAGVLGLQVLLADGAEAPQADSQPAPMRGYPPLPNFDSGYEPIWNAIFNWKAATPGSDAHRKAKAVESAIINQLRAYVDADRAARAPADSVTAPAGGVVEDCRRCHGSGEDPEGYYDQSRGDGGETLDGPCRECDGTGIAQPTPPAQAADSVLDRARIREIFMAHGFTVKEGQTDLKQYVYDAADALLRAASAPADSVTAPAATPAAASIAWNALRDATDPLGETGTRIMGLVRVFAQRQYEAGLADGRTTPPAPPADSVLEDAARLDWLQENSCDLRCIGAPTGGDDYDINWIVIEHHQATPHEREIGRSYTDDPRAAIDAARKQGGA